MSFSATSDFHCGNLQILRDFWSSRARNQILIGDSLVTANGIDERLGNAWIRAWDHPAKYGGYLAAWHSPGGNNPWRTQLLQSPNGQSTGHTDGVVTSAIAFGGEWYHGIPNGRIYDWATGVGHSFAFDDPQQRIVRMTINMSSMFADEWLTDDFISNESAKAALIYGYYGSVQGNHDGMCTTFALHTGAGDGTATANSPYTTASAYDTNIQSALSDAAVDSAGINVTESVDIDTTGTDAASSFQIFGTAAWTDDADDRSFVAMGIKYTNMAGYLMYSALGEDSWAIAGYGTAGTPSGSDKQFRAAEASQWLKVVYGHQLNAPLYVVVWIAPEIGTVAVNQAAYETIRTRFRTAWSAAGGTQDPRFIFIGSFRANSDAYNNVQIEAMRNVAAENNDSVFLNVYGLMGGIRYDNEDTGGDQSVHATSKGWNAIVHDNGTLDVSALDCLSDNYIHPTDAAGNGAFFLAYVPAEYTATLIDNYPKAAETPRIAAVYPSTLQEAATTTTISNVHVGPNQSLVVLSAVRDNDATDYPITGVTFGSENLRNMKADRASITANIDSTADIWYMGNPTAGTQTVTVTYQAGVANCLDTWACAVVIEGGELSDGLENASASGTDSNDSTPEVTITPTEPDCLCLAVWICNIIAGGNAPGALATQDMSGGRYAGAMAVTPTGEDASVNFGLVMDVGDNTEDISWASIAIQPRPNVVSTARGRQRGRARSR